MRANADGTGLISDATKSRSNGRGRAVKAIEETPPLAIPFGLRELDATGTVRRYTPESGHTPSTHALAIIGRNFFTEFLPIDEV